jgi:hypothetical protein
VVESRNAPKGVVLPEKQPVFRAGGEKSIGLIDPSSDEIIDENPNERVVAS